MDHKISKLSVAVAAAITLSACGGSDGSNNSNNNSGPVQAGGVIVTAMDGYIQNALLCADINNDGICQPEEAIKDTEGKYLLTDNKGKINAKISLADQDLLAKHSRLIATIQSVDPDSTIQTIDMDLPDQAMKAVTLRAPAGSETVSPITDLVVAKMKPVNGETEGVSKEEAEKAVLASLTGLNGNVTLEDTTILYGDYIEEKNSGSESAELAAKIHKTAQILTETKANASSDEAFDKHLDDVVSATITEVKDIAANSHDDLLDNSLKPSLPVTDDSVGEMVTNYVAQFNTQAMAELASRVEKLEGVYGDADMWVDSAVSVPLQLVTDTDNKGNTISIANDIDLRKANLAVTLANDTLTISRVHADKAVAKGTYKILLATNDLNSKGDVVSDKIISAIALELTVESFNHAPTLNDSVAETVAGKVLAIKLEQGTEVNATIDITGLFEDKNGDVLTYTAEVTLPGITAKIVNQMVILSGNPSSALENSILTITASDGALSKKAEFTLSKVIVIEPSELRDILVDSNEPWYRWNGEETTANCMGLKFITGETLNEGVVMFAEGQKCPENGGAFTKNGTWSVGNSGEVIWTLDSGEKIKLNGLIDKTADQTQPRIKTFEIEQTTTAHLTPSRGLELKAKSNGRGLTFFQGLQSAENYWNFSEGNAWVYNEDHRIELTATHGQFTAHEQKDLIDVDLYIDNVSCEDLGFVKDEGNSEHNGYKPGDLRADFFSLFSEGLNGNVINFSSQNTDKPYAFAGKDDDGTEFCGINLDVSKQTASYLNTDFKAGQALTIYYSPKSDNTDEEFIINTFIDRDQMIEPKANLVIGENGIFFADGMTAGHISKDESGKVVEEFAVYNGTGWTQWQPMDGNEGEQVITPYSASNGNAAYQFWFKGPNQTESFTIWSDDSRTLMFKDAGDRGEAAPMGPIYHSEKDVKAAIEAQANKGISFVGTTWRETFVTEGSEDWDYAEFTYSAEGVSVVEVTNGMQGEPIPWPYNPSDTDLPCRDTAPHSCSYTDLNDSYEYEYEQVRWTWDPSNPDTIIREKGQHKSEWKRLN